LNSPPPSFSFILPPPIPEIVSTGLNFPFSYLNTLYFYHIHPPTPFLFLFFSFFYFIFFYIYLHVYTLFGPPLPSPPQNLFCPLVYWFCWRENIRDNKKDIAFLLVWGKDNSTGRFLALLPLTCVLQPTLVHLCTPLCSGLCQFKITIFTPLQCAHQPHSSFWFPSLSLLFLCTFSP
jgi:hypothetical protein